MQQAKRFFVGFRWMKCWDEVFPPITVYGGFVGLTTTTYHIGLPQSPFVIPGHYSSKS